jgi:hypothetical protein
MRMRYAALVLAAVLLVLGWRVVLRQLEGSGQAAAVTRTWSAAEDAAPFTAAPMTFVADEGVTSGEVVSMGADGRLFLDGRPWMRITKRELQELDGKTIGAVSTDGRIVGRYLEPLSFDGDDLMRADGLRMSVDGQGQVTAKSQFGRLTKTRHLGRIAGAVETPSARRAALLLVSCALSRPHKVNVD